MYSRLMLLYCGGRDTSTKDDVIYSDIVSSIALYSHTCSLFWPKEGAPDT